MDDWDDPLMTWQEWCCLAALVLFAVTALCNLFGFGFGDLFDALPEF